MSPTDVDIMYWTGILIGILGFFTSILVASVVRNVFYSSKKTNANKQQFVEREKEINRLVSQILTGQSAAIVSVFSKERTEILGYLDDPSNSEKLYGDEAKKLIFSKVNINSLFLENGKGEREPRHFWEQALKPLENKIKEGSDLYKIYQVCREKQFEKFYLDNLITKLKKEELRLVLMLDKFDEMLESSLDTPVFFATLRELASSRNPSSLSLIISGDISLKQFHAETKNEGSPFLNFMDSCEIVLRPLAENEIDNLLGEEDFSKSEQQFIKEISGGHVYFIRLAISVVRDAKANNEFLETTAKEEFCNKVKNILKTSWDEKICKAVLNVVRTGTIPDSQNYEIKLLEKQGFLKKDSENKWHISPSILVDCISSKTEQELCKP